MKEQVVRWVVSECESVCMGYQCTCFVNARENTTALLKLVQHCVHMYVYIHVHNIIILCVCVCLGGGGGGVSFGVCSMH